MTLDQRLSTVYHAEKLYNTFFSYLHDVDETEERMNKQLAEAAKRENVLVLRLSAREQELQDVAAVANKYRQQQVIAPVYNY